MNETCEKMLTTMSLICQQIESAPWIDDFEYICWAYLVGDRILPLKQQIDDSENPLLAYLQYLKISAESINGWVNDVTYFEMERWLVLYKHWKSWN